jgi:nucleotide-binding universal stress UspA family protein
VKQIRIERPRAGREHPGRGVLPPDRWDPDVVRAKALARGRRSRREVTGRAVTVPRRAGGTKDRAAARAGGPRARYGAPAKELRSVTAGRDADAIVIGAPGRFPHRFAGSAAAWLAKHARYPAVIVP